MTLSFVQYKMKMVVFGKPKYEIMMRVKRLQMEAEVNIKNGHVITRLR